MTDERIHEQRRYRRLAQNRPETVLNRDDHGTRYVYVAGCRCDPCTDADLIYQRTRYSRRKRKAS